MLNSDINLLQVIGIHKKEKVSRNLCTGTFIGEIFKDPRDDLNQEIIDNYIIAEISINEENINKDIRIINSYDEYARNNENSNEEKKSGENNEEEIRKCEIKINDELIPFSYFHQFNKEGNFIIKYSFKNFLENINFMFCECKYIKKINLSNFNSQNVTNISNMFYFVNF